MNKIKDFQLLIYTSRRLNLISSNDSKFNYGKISDYLILDIYDIDTIREYAQLCDYVKLHGYIQSGNSNVVVHSKNGDLDFLKKQLTTEFRERVLSEYLIAK